MQYAVSTIINSTTNQFVSSAWYA